MCGIVGIAGHEDVSTQLFHCLENLEYRGYDSCGVAVMTLGDHAIELRKNVGSVNKVNEIEHLTEPQGHVGLAHTRWATHGGVTKGNAHPHFSGDKAFAVIHNGIISNYQELRANLIAAGHEFRSETDTEVIPHLLEEAYCTELNVEQALLKTFQQLEGTFAFAFVTTHAPDRIFCARKESPLVLGVGTDRMFLASDINSFIEYTHDIVHLNNGEYAIITADQFIVKNSIGERLPRSIQRISWSPAVAQKGGFSHFMLKEIYEQPMTVRTVLKIDPARIQKLAQMILNHQRTYLVGVGTTYYVSLIAHYYFAKLANKSLPAVSSDEFGYVAEVDPKTLFLCSSQSGETYDTLRALQFAKDRGATSAAIVNVVGSSLSREVDEVILQESGPEICVLSTKAAIAQMVILLRIAVELGKMTGVFSDQQYCQYQADLQTLPESIQYVLDYRILAIKTLADNFYKNNEKKDDNPRRNIKNWLFLGRGIYMAITMEAALKMKEVTYQHVEGMSGGFMKHGTISLIDDDMYTLVMVPPKEEKDLYDATMSNVEEVKARGGFVVGVHYDDPNPKFNAEIILPAAPAIIAPLLELVVGQLFAYYAALALGRNIDKPRSLAKSVTVA